MIRDNIDLWILIGVLAVTIALWVGIFVLAAFYV